MKYKLAKQFQDRLARRGAIGFYPSILHLLSLSILLETLIGGYSVAWEEQVRP